MNFAHIHLILNHIPLLTLPLACVFLIHSLKSGSLIARRFAYSVIILCAAAVVPVYFTGEPAEDLVEAMAGVSKPAIEEHEEAAEISVVLTLLCGATALVGLFGPAEGRKEKAIHRAVIATVVIAVLSLGYTSTLGGRVRHSEIRPSDAPPGNPESD